jgi:hypothetical protein
MGPEAGDRFDRATGWSLMKKAAAMLGVLRPQIYRSKRVLQRWGQGADSTMLHRNLRTSPRADMGHEEAC